MSSSSSLVSSSRRIGEEEEDNEKSALTGMNFGIQKLEERVIAERTATCTTTQLRTSSNVPSISDTIGCDITIEDIQSVKKELLNQGVDLKKDVNESTYNRTPLIHFCLVGNLRIVKLLCLIGADCTKSCEADYWFPMLAAAYKGHLDICKWLFEYGGDAKYQINKETTSGHTPLWQSYYAWWSGDDNEGKTCRWLLRNNGGQHLSPKAMRELRITDDKEEWNSNLLVLWIRENIQLHHTFILLLCGATTMIATTSSSLRTINGRTRKRKLERKIHPGRSLQILAGHPGIFELIGNCVGLIRGKEIRMLQEFNESVIEYNNSEDVE